MVTAGRARMLGILALPSLKACLGGRLIHHWLLTNGYIPVVVTWISYNRNVIDGVLSLSIGRVCSLNQTTLPRKFGTETLSLISISSTTSKAWMLDCALVNTLQCLAH